MLRLKMRSMASTTLPVTFATVYRSFNKFFKLRSISTSVYLYKTPRVLPVTHQVLGEHNAQYFTPYPHLTREEMEEPPPRVSEEVRELLQLRRKKLIGENKWLPPKINGYRFRQKRKELIKAGHYFPVFPSRDRMIDPMPKVRQHILKKEERLKNIELNMQMMPDWIAEYKAKIREKKIKQLADQEEQKRNKKYIEKLGLHPKDPRAKEVIEGLPKKQPEKLKKKKYSTKKKPKDEE